MSRGGSPPSRRIPARSAAPQPTHRRSPTSCSPGAARARPSGSPLRWPPPAPRRLGPPSGRSSHCRSRPGAPAPAAEAKEMFDRTIGSDPRPAAPQSRAIYRMRDGHRREYDASRDRGSISFRERCRGALADVGIYRCVSFRDLAETHFGGHPYTTRRAVNAWTREGLAKESTAKGPKGRPFKVLTLTRKGAAAIRDLDAGHGLDPGQHIRSAARLLQHAQLAHDTAIYRACGRERQRLLGHPARTARRRAQERCRAPERVRAGERRSPGRGRRAAPRGPGVRLADRCPRPGALPRCADRVRRRRGAERPSECRDRLGPLPPGICPGQGRGRVPDARKRAGRSAGA